MRIGIIGGGPGGAVAAATLARSGHEVHIFENEVFPRFHIGESLLPCNMTVYEAIGLPSEQFTAHHYQPKHAAHFELSGSGRCCRFPFSDGLPGDPPSIFQVERSKFDHMLLKHAVAQGALLHCPSKVTSVDLPSDDKSLPVLHIEGAAAGAPGQMQVDFVIDASGRETLLARQLGLVDRSLRPCRRVAARSGSRTRRHLDLQVGGGLGLGHPPGAAQVVGGPGAQARGGGQGRDCPRHLRQ